MSLTENIKALVLVGDSRANGRQLAALASLAVSLKLTTEADALITLCYMEFDREFALRNDGIDGSADQLA